MTNRQFSLKALMPNLLLLVIAPLIVYFALRALRIDNTLALALAGLIPVVRTIMMFIRKKRLSILGIVSVSGFLLACLMTAVFGGGTLILKLYHPIITAAVGIIVLISAAVKKPLLLFLLRIRGVSQEHLKKENTVRRAQSMTAILGFFLVIDALLHIFIAVTLPTETFMVLSRAITIGLIILLFATMRFARSKFPAHDNVNN